MSNNLNDARWEEHQKFIEDRTQEKWILDAKKTLDWFLEVMGQEEWTKRKKSIVTYFKKQQMSFFLKKGEI